MKKFLFDWFIPSSYERVLSGMVLLLIGMLVINKGRIGIQATPESEVSWIEAFSRMDAWFGWTMVLMGLDSLFFRGKALAFLLSKTVIPFVRVVLSSVLGEERFGALMRRLEKRRREKVRDKPLTLIEVRDLSTKSKSQVLLTVKAYEDTAESVLDYAKQRKVEVSMEVIDD